ncbi:hypothetical protein, partial [Stenotrophomonas maltophilia]|uniref:hypothetical protein n=1 Tax=Stenotrophomonas maltophilia TaxID=40324 RepID=UPI0039C0CE5C
LSTRPWGLGRGIHAADTPRNRIHPAFDSFPLLSEWHELLLVGVDLGRHDEHGNDRNRFL